VAGGRPHQPERSCVGCGTRAGKEELVRLAIADLREHDGRPGDAHGPLTAVIDAEGRLGGRGAYLCREGETELPRAECLTRAIRRSSVGRTLRASVSVDPKLVESVGR
jgi:uncharacterized protein